MMFWIELLKAIPEIIRLLKYLEDTQSNERLKDDVNEIHEAFQNKDMDTINRIWNSRLSDIPVDKDT